jgi:DNA-binding HxlR family transcriptional regulator
MPSITEKMLTQHLRELEADKLVRRKVLPVVPPHVEYTLTKIAMELIKGCLKSNDCMGERNNG